MKKIIIAITLFISSFVNAQQEVSIDIADALVMKTLEFSYEYYIGPQNSIGISALFNFNDSNSDFTYNEDTMVTPYFRHYFTNNRNWNYFGELFLGINSGEKQINSSRDNTKKYTDGAVGVSVGLKYISNGGLVVSPLLGLGRNMFSEDSYEVVPRAGLNIGYRF